MRIKRKKTQEALKKELDEELKENAILSAARLAMSGKKMTEESVNQAIDYIRRKRFNKEIPENFRIELRLVKAVMAENRRRKKRKKILSQVSIGTGITTLIGIIVLIFLFCFGGLNSNPDDWKDYLTISSVDYKKLRKEEISSIKDLNQEKKAHFFYLDELTPTHTYLLYNGKKRIIIEEEYNYDGTICTIYAVNENTMINNFSIDLDVFNHATLVLGSLRIDTGDSDDNQYCRFLYDYQYYMVIQSADSSTIEPIISLLSND